MSLKSTVMQAVVQVMPDRDRDELSDAHRVLGKPIDRLDGLDKVTGVAPFSAEFPLPGLVYAALAYSTVAKGTIQVDRHGSRGKGPRGTRGDNAQERSEDEEPSALRSGGGSGAAGSKINVLNIDEIFYDGQPIAVAVADTQERAEEAAKRITATYDTGEAKLSFDAAKAGASHPKQVMMEDTKVQHGDPEAALQAAAFVVDERYDTPRYNHNPIELHATTAVWEGDDRLTVYDASQFISGCAETLSEIFSLKKEDVRVISLFVGGGFGSKGSVWPHVQLSALAAKVTGKPVRLVVSREGVFRIVGGRTPSDQRVALAAGGDGKLLSLIHTGVTATSFTNDFPEQFTFPARHMYASENLLVDQSVVHLNTTANTFMRAPGESIGTFALESAMDELAYKTGIDPVELRLRNDAPEDPAKKIPFSARHFKEAFRLGAEKFGWEKRPREVRSQRDGDWLIGQGVAAAYYPVYRRVTSAHVRLNADGTAVVQCAAQAMGMGTSTVQTQHAAERLGLPMEKVRFEYGDTDLPKAGVAGGSSQTISIALAVEDACEKLHKELLKLVDGEDRSPLNGAKLEEVEARSGGLFRRKDRTKGETYAAILARAEKSFIDAEATTGKPMETLKYSMQSYGAQFCEIRVNEITGEARVARWVGAFDTGRILNAKTARSQFLGGIIMGIGMALTEETYFDERMGRIMNPSLAEYHVPVALDVPEIEAYALDIPDPHTPLGAHGIGEIGITGAAAAVANAIYHATGNRIRSLPITLDKLM